MEGVTAIADLDAPGATMNYRSMPIRGNLHAGASGAPSPPPPVGGNLGPGASYHLSGQEAYSNSQSREEFNPFSQPDRYLVFNCLDVAGHVQYCPICSQFYHCERTPYLIAIIVLVIVCIILFKQVIERR